MSLTIRCDYVDEAFQRCSAELSGLSFNAKPADWTVRLREYGDHSDYCPEHAKLLHGVSDTTEQR